MITTKEFHNILIIRLRAVGDVLLSTPVVRAIKENYPQSQISMLVERPLVELVEGNPYLDEVIVFDRTGLKALPWWQSLWQQFQFMRLLRRKKFDLIIDLFSGTRSGLHTLISGAPVRVGYDLPWRRLYYNLRVKPQRKLMHTVEHQLEMVRALGFRIESKDLWVPIFPEDREWVEKILADHQIPPEKMLVIIHPGAGYPLKIWKPAGFARLADELVARYGAQVILSGDANDADLVHRIQKSMSTRPLILAAKTNLRQLAALIERADLFIGSDSGPMHMAAALKTPVVAIFGPSDYRRWRPWDTTYTIVRKDVPCSPCRHKKCDRGKECLESLQFEEVWEAVEGLIHQLDLRGKWLRNFRS